MQLMTPFLHQFDQPRVRTHESQSSARSTGSNLAVGWSGASWAAFCFWKRSGSAAETVLGLEKLLRKLVCHCTFVYVRCDHCVLSFEACRARMEPAVAAPDTEGCFEVKRVKTSILLDPQYLGDISIGVSCGSCQSSLPHAHRLHA